MREGLVSLREGRFADSLQRFDDLFARGIDSFEAHYYAARALTGLKRWDAAARKHEGAIGRLPSYTAAYIGLADARMEARRLPEALDAVDRGLAASPGDPRLLEKKGDIARMQGRVADAVATYEGVVRRAPRDALIRVKLGELFRDLDGPPTPRACSGSGGARAV
ncbi:MAG: tetratricopeptide repeat protein [Vicinamibacterales bacterium]